jgi:hypothetical protein
MIWFVALSGVVVLAEGWLTKRARSADAKCSSIALELYRIRCRLRVARFEADVRRDAASVHRRLRAELDALNRREREQ